MASDFVGIEQEVGEGQMELVRGFDLTGCC